jgi:hypothetical protein
MLMETNRTRSGLFYKNRRPRALHDLVTDSFSHALYHVLVLRYSTRSNYRRIPMQAQDDAD